MQNSTKKMKKSEIQLFNREKNLAKSENLGKSRQSQQKFQQFLTKTLRLENGAKECIIQRPSTNENGTKRS